MLPICKRFKSHRLAVSDFFDTLNYEIDNANFVVYEYNKFINIQRLTILEINPSEDDVKAGYYNIGIIKPKYRMIGASTVRIPCELKDGIGKCYLRGTGALDVCVTSAEKQALFLYNVTYLI